MPDQTIRANLEINASGNAKRELKETTKAAEDLAKQRRELGKQTGNDTTPTGKKKDDDKGYGYKEIVAQGFAIYASLRTVSEGLKLIGQAAALAGNETLTTSQKIRQFSESVPLLGSVAANLRTFVEGTTGVTEKLRAATLLYERQRGILPLEGQANSQRLALQAEALSARAYAQALAGGSPTAPGFGRGGTAPGFAAAAGLGGLPRVQFTGPAPVDYRSSLEFQSAERRAPIEIERRRAQAELERQQALQGQAEADQARLQKDLAAAREQERTARDRYTRAAAIANGQHAGQSSVPNFPTFGLPKWANPLTPFSYLGDWARSGAVDSNRKVSQIPAAQDSVLASQKQLEILRQIEEAQRRASAAATAGAQAESAARKANLALQREELNMLKQRYADARGQAAAFGSLSDVEREEALRVAQRAKQAGYGSLTPEEKAVLQQSGLGTWLQDEAVKSAQNDPRFKERQGLFNLDADLGKLAQQAVTVNANITASVQIDEDKLAQRLGEILQKAFEGLIKTIEVKLETQRRDQRNNENLKNSLQ